MSKINGNKQHFTYRPFDELDGIPHIIVDSYGIEGSKLVISHWSSSTPRDKELQRSTSAQMVWEYLQGKALPEGVNVVSNNHFDQDGIVSMLGIINRDFFLKHSEMLIDVATSGDCGRYKNRDAARISMAIAQMCSRNSHYFTQEEREAATDWTSLCYERFITELPKMLENVENYKDYWKEEDEFLTQSQQYIKQGTVTIEEDHEHDLATVKIPSSLERRRCHKLCRVVEEPIHLMAVIEKTDKGRLLYAHGAHFMFFYTYEASLGLRKSFPTTNLQETAKELSHLDNGLWKYEAGNGLKREDGEASEIELQKVQEVIIKALEKGTAK